MAFWKTTSSDGHMKRMKTNPNILTEPPSPTTSPTKLKHQSSRYWNENPEASSVDSLYLEEKTKAAIGELYNLIDTNGDTNGDEAHDRGL